MTNEIAALYKQILTYYFAFMKGKLVKDDSINRPWQAQQIQNEANKLTECFLAAFPNDQILALELDPLVTNELCAWSLDDARQKNSHYRFLEHMIEVLNQKTIEYRNR